MTNKPFPLYLLLFYLNLALWLLLLFSCGTTKSALRTHEDLKWAKDNYHSNTLRLFAEVFRLENRDLRNGGVYHLTELYFALKVTPLPSTKTPSAKTKKLSPKQRQKRNEYQSTKAQIVTLLKKQFFLEKDFNTKNVILSFIASLGEEAYWSADLNWRKEALSKNALFIAEAITDTNLLVSRYALTLLAKEKQLNKYQHISRQSQQQIISIVEEVYQNEAASLSPVLGSRLYRILEHFNPQSAFLKKMQQQFSFLRSRDE